MPGGTENKPSEFKQVSCLIVRAFQLSQYLWLPLENIISPTLTFVPWYGPQSCIPFQWESRNLPSHRQFSLSFIPSSADFPANNRGYRAINFPPSSPIQN